MCDAWCVVCGLCVVGCDAGAESGCGREEEEEDEDDAFSRTPRTRTRFGVLSGDAAYGVLSGDVRARVRARCVWCAMVVGRSVRWCALDDTFERDLKKCPRARLTASSRLSSSRRVGTNANKRR